MGHGCLNVLVLVRVEHTALPLQLLFGLGSLFLGQEVDSVFVIIFARLFVLLFRLFFYDKVFNRLGDGRGFLLSFFVQVVFVLN